jgi:hypothetical protein
VGRRSYSSPAPRHSVTVSTRHPRSVTATFFRVTGVRPYSLSLSVQHFTVFFPSFALNFFRYFLPPSLLSSFPSFPIYFFVSSSFNALVYVTEFIFLLPTVCLFLPLRLSVLFSTVPYFLALPSFDNFILLYVLLPVPFT